MAFLVGDVHGRYEDLYIKLSRFKKEIRKNDVVLLGDSMVGYNPTFEKFQLWPKWNTFFRNLKSTLYLIRGNHDDPSWFDGGHDFPHVKFVQDYSIIKTKSGHCNKLLTLLAIGGGISINRLHRTMKEGKNWFKDEVVRFEHDKLINIKDKIDILISHTCPSICADRLSSTLILDSWLKFDENLYSDLRQERQNMDNILDYLIHNNKPYSWYYGHMHQSHQIKEYDIIFKCLDQLEIIMV